MNKTVFLVLTSAIGIKGEVVKAGALVEVSNTDAKNLLHRGKARLATEKDGAQVAEPEPAAEVAPASIGGLTEKTSKRAQKAAV